MLTRETLLQGVRELCAVDDDLAAAVERFGPPPMWGRRPGFATLVRIILEQQVSLGSAEATYIRLQRAVERVTAHSVAALSLTELQQQGITRQKASYCLGLARHIVDRELNLSSLADGDDDAARRVLLEIRGIGPWTADIYLLMALRRPDVWPDGDLALAESARRIRGLPTRPTYDRLRQIAEAWKPWRSVAARILWHDYLCERRAHSLSRGSRAGH